jgi:hypothetical protein
VAQGRLLELPIAKPLVPLLVGLYTRSDGPASSLVKAAAQVIIQIARRTAARGDLRSTAPIGQPERGVRGRATGRP